MPSIRTVNLVWERRVRGSYAVSRFALDDAGSVTLVLPRPLEARTYDLTRLASDGAADIRATFSVETLLELEASATSDSVIAMTSDDLYLIHGGSKKRFLAEKHVIFVDSALSMDGNLVVASYSDRAGSSFALALGDISGRVSWLREADAPLSAVAVSPEGGFICQAAENGSILLLAASRREQWLFQQKHAVHSLACAPMGRITVYGTTAGGVGLIDAEGSRIWESCLPGSVVAVAVSADGGVSAVITRPTPGNGTTRLFVLDRSGQIGWEYETERLLVGLAISPSGQYIAASSRDGTHAVYETVFGQAGSDAGVKESIAASLLRAESCRETHDWAGAACHLRAALDERPSEVAACERLLALQAEQSKIHLQEARDRFAIDDYSGAAKTLETLKVISPNEPELYALMNDVRSRWESREIARADACLEHGDLESAGTILSETLGFAPHSLEARRRLSGLVVLEVQRAEAEAERLLANDELEEGLAALERAQRIDASDRRAEKIQRAQIALEFAEGMRAYKEKSYREAIFQFKKVLVRDPNHADARRHLNFAERFEQDSNEALNDRFGRLE